jgi:hypothetical protein
MKWLEMFVLFHRALRTGSHRYCHLKQDSLASRLTTAMRMPR